MTGGPDILHALHLLLHVDQQLGPALSELGITAYILLFAIVFCEIGLPPLFFLPGDPLLFFCGAFAATGAINLWGLMSVLFIAALTGSMLSYRIGHGLGKQAFTRDYRWLDKAALKRTHTFYERHGGITMLVSPFIAVVRTFAPLIAGISGMTYSRFLPFAGCGCALWVVSLVAAGYFFGNIPFIRDHLSGIVLLGIGLGVGAVAISSLWRWLRKPRA